MTKPETRSDAAASTRAHSRPLRIDSLTGRLGRAPLTGRGQIAKRGVSRFDLRDPYYLAIGMSTRWFALVSLSLYLSTNAFFATLYYLSPGCIANTRHNSFSDLFFFSVETLATVGYGNMAPATFYGHVVSSIEILVGMAFTAIITGLIFVRFSKPRSKIRFADHAVVTNYNGRPTLMLRIGNARMGLLTSAAVQLSAMLPERSQEGQSLRRIHDLKLVRPRLPAFPLTWTLMHEIDENSPLHGYDATRLKDLAMRLFVVFEARDHALAATVYDVHDYRADEILFGMRYQDSISTDENGTTVADLDKLSLIEPDS